MSIETLFARLLAEKGKNVPDVPGEKTKSENKPNAEPGNIRESKNVPFVPPCSPGKISSGNTQEPSNCAGSGGVVPPVPFVPPEKTKSENIRERAAVVRFVLSDTYGNAPTQGAGVLIGAEGDTIEDLKTSLERKYGTRLVSMKP